MVYFVELNKTFLYSDRNITTVANGAPLTIIICYPWSLGYLSDLSYFIFMCPRTLWKIEKMPNIFL